MQLIDLRPRVFAVRYLTLFLGEAFAKACVLIAFAHLARVLSPTEYGVVETALSVTVFFVLGVESGMGAYGAKVVAAAPAELPRLLPRVMLLRSLLGIPAMLGIGALVLFSKADVVGLLAISGFAVLLTPFLTQWVFQGLRQMQWVAAGGALRNLVFAALVLILVQPGSDIRLVAVAEVAGVAALALFSSVYLYGRLGVRLDLRGTLAGTRQLFGEVWPLGLSDFTWACFWYSPLIIAGWTNHGNAEHVAWVAAPTRLVMALHTFVWLYFFNLLPNLAKELSGGLDTWRDLMRRSLAISTWPAGLIAVGGTLLAPILIPIVFGAQFAPAVLPFQIVIWMIPVAAFSGHFRFSLIAAGQQRWEFATLAIGAGVTVVSAVALTYSFGSPGAAVAFLAGGIANAVLATWASERHVGSIGGFGSLSPWLGASALGLLLGVVGTKLMGPVAGALVGCAVYVAVGVRQENQLVQAVKAWLRR